MTFNLLGDYELLIDELLNGDPHVKQMVAEADVKNRGGLASLKHHLGKAKATVPSHLQQIMRSCEFDQDLHAMMIADFRKVEKLPSGKRRVTVQVEHNRIRQTFDDHLEAIKWRDRMELLLQTLQFEKSDF